MSSSEDYFLTLRTPRDEIALALGVDLSGLANALFTENATLATMGALVKLLVDQGVLTDNQVQNALTDAATGADGSIWAGAGSGGVVVIDDVFSHIVEETFEGGSAGVSVGAGNSVFASGQAGDSLLPSAGSATFDSTQKYAGTYSMKVTTADGWSRAMRTATYFDDVLLYVRFYFRAAAAPLTSGCRIYIAQMSPDVGGSGIGAEKTLLSLAVDSSGVPHMYDGVTERTPGSTPPSICDGTWWRVEAGFDRATATCGTKLFGGVNVATTTPSFSWTGTYDNSNDRLVNSAMVGQPGSALTSGQTWSAWFDNVDFGIAYVGP